MELEKFSSPIESYTDTNQVQPDKLSTGLKVELDYLQQIFDSGSLVRPNKNQFVKTLAGAIIIMHHKLDPIFFKWDALSDLVKSDTQNLSSILASGADQKLTKSYFMVSFQSLASLFYARLRPLSPITMSKINRMKLIQKLIDFNEELYPLLDHYASKFHDDPYVSTFIC